jgi:hypothetical protein
MEWGGERVLGRLGRYVVWVIGWFPTLRREVDAFSWG